MVFEGIIGNEKNKELLKKIVLTNKIPHSYIFEGKEGIGKKLFAKEFAKAVLCLNKEYKPCLKCKSCIEFDNDNNPDVTVIEPDGTSIKIEQIREMKQKILEKPIVSDRKIYIINDSEKMTKEAQNSLLKVLEEPPEYVCIILITANINLFLNTIKSRCIKLSFEPLKSNEMKEILYKKLGYDNIPNSILEFSEGSIEKTLKLNEKKEIYLAVDEVFSKLDKINIIDLLNSKDRLFKDKEEIYSILDYINIILFKKVKESIKDERYINAINITQDAKERLVKNNNYDMTLDRFIVKLWEEIND